MLRSELGTVPQGTLNNCSNGHTPWNTYLTCEENWNGYFGTTAAGWTPTALEARYGVTAAGGGYNWHLADSRFDVNRNRNEMNRFGWVVEIDPFDPTSTPVKRTALGRLKHEGATFQHAVMPWSTPATTKTAIISTNMSASNLGEAMREQGRSPLDEGTLYVAKFNADGTGQWLPVVFGQGVLTTANGWANQADVLIRTRLAADAVGATKLDRPEWASVHPITQDVFVTLTNGTGWGALTAPTRARRTHMAMCCKSTMPTATTQTRS